MVTRLAPDARTIVKNAETAARSWGSPSIEAEHLLLSISSQPSTKASSLLKSVGLTHQKLLAAFDREFAESLAAAGVSVADESLTRFHTEPGDPARQRPRFGASAKAAMARAVSAATGSRQIRSEHLLVGALGAGVGTVPRALRLANVDPEDLTSRAMESANE